MAPHVTTGINTVTRRRLDGSTFRSFYDRRTGKPLGTDRDAAILAALDDTDALPSMRLTKRLDGAVYDHRLAIGEAGETLVRSELVAAGLIVCMPSSGAVYDMVVDDGRGLWRVQVKTRNPGARSCTFLLFDRKKGASPAPRNYHALGVDLFALVSWYHRAVVFTDARDAAGVKSITIPLMRFANQEAIGIRWERITDQVRHSRYATDAQRQCNIITDNHP